MAANTALLVEWKARAEQIQADLAQAFRDKDYYAFLAALTRQRELLSTQRELLTEQLLRLRATAGLRAGR